MRGHNIYFDGEIRKIIFELSLIAPLIWSSEILTFKILHVLLSFPKEIIRGGH